MVITMINRTVIITGGNKGIGKACAIRFAKNGDNVVIAARERTSALRTVNEISSFGANAVFIETDVSDFQQVCDMAEYAVKQFGSIDVLVNNAGITADAFIDNMTLEQWERVIAINLTGTFLCIKAVLPYMEEQKIGRIINISSVAARKGAIAQSNYAASKAGIIGMTLSLAQELGSKNITVNAIAPGYVATAMTEGLPEKIKDRAVRVIPAHRFGIPEEVADAVFYMASKGAAYCNGAVLDINGGISL